MFVNVASSASLITDPTPYIPEEYEMTIEKKVANCDGMTVADYDAGNCDLSTTNYELGQTVYFTIKYSNDSSAFVPYAVITDEYDTRLSFDSVVYSTQ